MTNAIYSTALLFLVIACSAPMGTMPEQKSERGLCTVSSLSDVQLPPDAVLGMCVIGMGTNHVIIFNDGNIEEWWPEYGRTFYRLSAEERETMRNFLTEKLYKRWKQPLGTDLSNETGLSNSTPMIVDSSALMFVAEKNHTFRIDYDFSIRDMVAAARQRAPDED